MTQTRALVPHASKAVRALIEAGIVPEMCTRFELKIAANEVIRAKCEFLLSEEQMEKIATALRDHPEEAKAIARTFWGRRQVTVGSDQEQFVEVQDL